MIEGTHTKVYSIHIEHHSVQLGSVQSLSHVRLFVTPWIAARQASLSITNSQSSPKLLSNESVMPSSRLILGHPLLLLPSIPPSIRIFSNESTLHMRWLKYWSFSFNIIPSKEHPGLISFRMDWLDLLAVQGTLKSLLQCHSSKASILRHSALHSIRQLEFENFKTYHLQQHQKVTYTFKTNLCMGKIPVHRLEDSILLKCQFTQVSMNFSIILMQTPEKFFVATDKWILKFTWNVKKTAKTIPEEKKSWVYIPHFKKSVKLQ